MRRLLTVNFVPCALFVTCLYVLVRAGSFSGRSQWHAALSRNLGSMAGTVLGLTACTAVLALVLHPFQVRAVRVLEGYWDRWEVTSRLAGVLVEVQRRKREGLRASGVGYTQPSVATGVERLGEQARAERGYVRAERIRVSAMRRLGPELDPSSLLPTALGNALRAGELAAGERYGLATLASWPRIYMQVSRRMVQALDETRDALDAAVNLCHSFLAIALVLAVALHDEPGEWWIPVSATVLSALSYKGAVIAAQSYSGLMLVVYDLHRFDLLKALHYRLPDSTEEWGLFSQLSDLFVAGGGAHARHQAERTVNWPYDHGGSGPDDGDGSTGA